MNLKQHPLSAAFPAMQADEYQALVDSIGNIGVQNPITLFEGMVLDGWHRYTAANESGMDCPTVELGDIDPRDFVLAQNKARRNLTASQRAAAVTSVYQWAPAHREKKGAAAAPLSKTNAELAVIAGTGVRSIQLAKTVHTDAVPAVQALVKSGGVSAEVAVAVSKMPAKQQNKIAAKGPDAMRAAAKPTHVEPEDADYSGPSDAELQAEQDAAKTDLDTVMELLESDDPKAALLQENERQRMEIATLKSQRDGYMNQANELIRRVKSLRKMLDKAQGK